jgi:hypothetical protein
MPIKKINIPVDPPSPKKLVKPVKPTPLPKEKLPRVSRIKKKPVNDY